MTGRAIQGGHGDAKAHRAPIRQRLWWMGLADGLEPLTEMEGGPERKASWVASAGPFALDRLPRTTPWFGLWTEVSLELRMERETREPTARSPLEALNHR